MPKEKTEMFPQGGFFNKATIVPIPIILGLFLFSLIRPVPTMGKVTITKVLSAQRAYHDYGWLKTYHTLEFYERPKVPGGTGSLKIVNEDSVEPLTGFPMHRHQDFEIFSYVLSGELTHRDSMSTRKAAADLTSKDFYVMSRGNVQFTSAGRGIAHSEQNEHRDDWVHFLQIWVSPWKRGLTPRYHTATFSEAEKRKGFVPIISPLKAGIAATSDEEAAAVPVIPGTIPIHADFIMGAAIIPPNTTFSWTVGSNGAVKKEDRIIYIHLPMTKDGRAKAKVNDVVLSEGDGIAFSHIDANESLHIESIGDVEAEVVLFDTDSDQ